MMLKHGLQKLAHLGLRVLLRLHCGFRVRRSLPRLDRPSLLIANHASHLDIAAIFCALPISEVSRVRTAAARDAIYALPGPAVAVVEFLFNTYPFERKGSTSSLETGAQAIREGWHLAIFPEGRRSPDGAFLGLTPGFAKIAYETGAPVVAMRIDGAHRALPRGKHVLQRLPVEVEFRERLEADRVVPYERRREAYALLMAQAAKAVGA
jgi:1-acyl-sn-glycerol-3-phosphate acyltransferase